MGSKFFFWGGGTARQHNQDGARPDRDALHYRPSNRIESRRDAAAVIYKRVALEGLLD